MKPTTLVHICIVGALVAGLVGCRGKGRKSKRNRDKAAAAAVADPANDTATNDAATNDAAGESAPAPKYPTLGNIERIDPAFDALVPADAKIEKLADGFEWAEGPVWIRQERPDGGFLVFSDVVKNVAHRWSESEGLADHVRPSGYTGKDARGGEPGSNGLTLDHQGRLVLCQHGDRRVARLEEDGSFTTLADRYDGKRFNSPNDLCYDRAGNLYFTDPPYGLEKAFEDPKRELPFTGVYRLSADGEVTLLTGEMSAPNGIALSPDERTLYVANSDPRRANWMAFDLSPDGTEIVDGRVFFDATDRVAGRKGLPDGLKVDVDGNVFATGPGGVYVFDPSGNLLGVIDPGEATANCGFGRRGNGDVYLYMTSDMNLCRIKVNTSADLPGPDAHGKASKSKK